MQKPNQFDLSRIRFDSDSMQALSLSRGDMALSLPLAQGPVNFTVIRSDGKFSNRWGAYVDGRGDAHVCCRDNPGAEKVSLHASGQRRVSIRSDAAKSAGAESRCANMWSEPEFSSEAAATFTLVFPLWGAGLDSADFPQGIAKDELLIAGHREKIVAVSFLIVDSAGAMRGRAPRIELGRLPLREGRTLRVVAWQEPQGDWMEQVRKSLLAPPRRPAQPSVGDDEHTMCVQGYRRPDSAYMVVLPVRYTSLESEDIIRDTSVRRRKAMQALADR